VFAYSVALLARFERTFMKARKTQMDVSVVLKEVASSAGVDPESFITAGVAEALEGERAAKSAGHPWYVRTGAASGSAGAAAGGDDDDVEAQIEADGTLWRGGARVTEHDDTSERGAGSNRRAAKYGGKPDGGSSAQEGTPSGAVAAGEFSSI